MSHIFISHSGNDNDAALRMRDWLAENGWDDVFLDVHPVDGIAAGERWQEALKAQAHRCEAVLALVSPNWLSSPWCRAEVQAAKLLGKRIFPILLTALPVESLPLEVRADHQAIRLADDAFAYERLKEGLRRAGLGASSFPFAEGRRPYPGLEPLIEEDAAIFFGREAQILRGLDRLRTMRDRGVERVMVILGASGAGKSSFLRAGLLPRLRRDDRNFLALQVIRPERSVMTGKLGLIAALETALNDEVVLRDQAGEQCPRSRAEIADYLDKSSDGLAGLTRELQRAWQPAPIEGETPNPPTIVLSIDQGEELIDPEGREEAGHFLDLLARTLAADKRLLVVIAARADVLPLLQQDAVLAGTPQEAFPLPTMLEGSFQLVIEGPTNVARPRFRIEPALVQALLEDARGQDALPLLAFTLERLHREHRAEGELKLTHYDRMGRMSGALDAAMCEVMKTARARRDLPSGPEALEGLLRQAMIPHLCRINEADEFARRVARVDEIPPASRPLIALLVDQRLLVEDRRRERDGEFSVVEVAHEALLREWSVLRGWLSEEREFLTWRADVERSHRRWARAHGTQRHTALVAARALADSPWLYRRRDEIGSEFWRFLQLAKANRRLVAALALSIALPFLLLWSYQFLDDVYDFSYSTTGHGNWFELRPYYRPIPVLLAYCLSILSYMALVFALWVKAIKPRFVGSVVLKVALLVVALVGLCLLILEVFRQIAPIDVLLSA
jgi:TIR domain